MQKVAHGGFEPGKTKIVGGLSQERAGEVVGGGVSFGGQSIHLRSAWIGQPEQLAYFVEALPGGIVEGGPEHVMIELGSDMGQEGVSAAYDE